MVDTSGVDISTNLKIHGRIDMLFSPLKSGQIAAFFAKKEGGRINVVKLVKLIYLADRKSLDEYGFPVTFDHWVSMDNGPVPSSTYDLIKGSTPYVEDSWGQWIRGRENHEVSSHREFEDEDLNQLSNADIEILRNVWNEFGSFDQWQLVDYTHEHCAEWTKPYGSSRPINEVELFQALGRDSEQAAEQARMLQEQRDIDKMFAAL